MTNGNESRLDRIEAILETLAVELRETRQLTESNARSIQAWESRIDENRDAARQERAEIDRNILKTLPVIIRQVTCKPPSILLCCNHPTITYSWLRETIGYGGGMNQPGEMSTSPSVAGAAIAR